MDGRGLASLRHLGISALLIFNSIFFVIVFFYFPLKFMKICLK